MPSAADHTALDAVEVEVRRMLTDGVAGVRQGLADFGWSPGPSRPGGIIDTIWSHAADGRAHAQTGERADAFYVGLIANVAGDRAAAALRDRMRDRIGLPLSATGFRMLPEDSAAGATIDGRSAMWSDGQVVVELSVLPEIRQNTHTVPAAVQFAVQPSSAYPAGPAAPPVRVERQSEPARDSSRRRNEESRPGLE